MEQTYAFWAWFFTRALCVVYLIAFLSLMVQAKGLWGGHGVMPMAPFMKAAADQLDQHRYWQMPSIFWLSASDDMIYGVAVAGAIFAGTAFLGFAQGWCLLLCYGLYL